MGQQHCSVQEENHSVVIQRQINIYRWRADPSSNSYICRVSFKNAAVHQQQQRFLNFIKTSKENNYLQINKYLQGHEESSTKPSGEIIIFEDYLSTLASLTQYITIEEALYLLIAMTEGYRQLNAKFIGIPIDLSCCFKAYDGTVRVWINPDPKFNAIRPSMRRFYSQADIITEVLQMVEQITVKGKEEICFNFFRQIRNQLNHSAYNYRYIKQFTLNYASRHTLSIPWRLRVNHERSRLKISLCNPPEVVRHTAGRQNVSLYETKNDMTTSIFKKQSTQFTKKQHYHSKNVSITENPTSTNPRNYANSNFNSRQKPKNNSGIVITIPPKSHSSHSSYAEMKIGFPSSHIVDPVNDKQPALIRSQVSRPPASSNNIYRQRASKTHKNNEHAFQWNKCKTMNILMDDSDLKISIGDSAEESSHLNGSAYTGVLSRMGRNATVKKINNSICENT